MKRTKENEYKKALQKIALMGYGLKDEMRDWSNIGKNAVSTARESLSEKCKHCGTKKPYIPSEDTKLPRRIGA